MHEQLYDGMGEICGHTPLVALHRWAAAHGREDLAVYAKLESFNPGGSAKDRTARALVTDAIVSGRLRPGTMVVESSSGNLGLALARAAVTYDFDFHCVVDPRANPLTVESMRAFGATIHSLTEPDPDTGDWLTARRNRVAELLETHPDAISLDQYSNRQAIRAHADGTASEIMDALGHAPDHLYVAVSTTGTLGGCVHALHGEATTVHAVDSVGSVLFGGERGQRVLPGYGAGMIPALSEGLAPDHVCRIEPADAIEGARRLARLEAFLAGASGGAVMAAVAADLDMFHENEEIVVILHDGGTAYLPTIYNDRWVADNIDAEDTP